MTAAERTGAIAATTGARAGTTGDAAFGGALRRARRRRGLSLRGLQALVQYDFTYLGQVERGEKPGSPALAAACDEALAARGRLLSAFGQPAGPGVPDGAAEGGNVGGTRAAPPFVPDSVPIAAEAKNTLTGPVAVTPPTDPHALSIPVHLDCLQQFSGRTITAPGLSEAVEDYLAANALAVHQARDEVVRRRLLSLRAEACLLAGRTALFGTGQPVVARGRLASALEAATEAGDAVLGAAVLGHFAYVAWREGLTRAGAEYLTAARRLAGPAAVPRFAAWLDTLERRRAAEPPPWPEVEA